MVLDMNGATLTANAARLGVIGIRFIVDVAARAVSLCLHALSGKEYSYTTQQIFSVSDWFKVRGVNASSVDTPPSAYMVKGEVSRDRANHQFIGETMSDNTFRMADVEPAVPIAIAVRSPQPARLGFVDLRPEALFGGRAGIYSIWHRIFLSVSVGPDADTSRPLPIVSRRAA